MWVIIGPFDGESGALDFTKSKVLLPGKKYPVGRKKKEPEQLVINDPKISSEQGYFLVGSHTSDDVVNPNVVPTLSYHNTRPKALRLQRGQEEIPIHPDSQVSIQSADGLKLLKNVHIRCEWLSICCLSTVKTDLVKCAQIGLKVVPTYSANVTHHLVDRITAIPSVLISLVTSTHFVHPNWLQEILRLNSLPRGLAGTSDEGVNIEDMWAMVEEKKFQPAISPDLPPSLKTQQSWEPDRRREGLFKGLKFCFLLDGRQSSPLSEMLQLVTIAEGTPESIDVAGIDHGVLANQLSKMKVKADRSKPSGMKSGLVIVADGEVMRFALGDVWSQCVVVIRSIGLNFINSSHLAQAIYHIDTKHIDCGCNVDRASDLLPDFVPETHPEEESEPQGPTALAASTSHRHRSPPASEPLPEANPESLFIRKVPLKRRAKTTSNNVLLGLEDDSNVALNSFPIAPSSPPRPPDPSLLIPDTPALTRSNRLKRRAPPSTTFSSGSQFSQVPEIFDCVEPPLKKFKALFDESDPIRLAAIESGEIIEATQMRPLVIMEEEEEEALQHQTQAQQAAQPRSQATSRAGSVAPVGGGRKRKVGADLDGHGDMDIEEQQTQISVKKRAIESVNAIQRTSQSTIGGMHPVSIVSKSFTKKNVGAAPGKPDRDEGFLKALASTKRGKKAEDSFDREFNQLRISKPDAVLEQEDVRAREWDVWETMDRDVNLRGNFMTIVEIEPFRKDGSEAIRGGRAKCEWGGLSDFKKFKKKSSGQRSVVAVELVASQGDYGIGSVYWQDESHSQSSNHAGGKIQQRLPPQAWTQRQSDKPHRQLLVQDSDGEQNDTPAAKIKRKGKVVPTSEKNDSIQRPG